jgi:DNA-binding GntR family transcriptional regulator
MLDNATDNAGALSMPRLKKPHKSAVDHAYAVARDRAIKFQFLPGEPVNELELSRELGLSRAPIREALNRLVTDGLLTFVANRGFLCRRLDAAEIANLYAVRADIEAGGVRETLERRDIKGLKLLATRWRDVARHIDKIPIETLVKADEDFHLALAALSGSDQRVELLTHINARIRFVRLMNIESPTRRTKSFGEHEAIIKKLLAGDAAGAVDILRKHLSLSAAEVTESIKRGLPKIYASRVV